MSNLPTKSLLTQFNINSKTRCIAQCARLLSICNIAAFNPVSTPQWMLYSESLTIANLMPSTNATVVDFERNNSNESKKNPSIDSKVRSFFNSKICD